MKACRTFAAGSFDPTPPYYAPPAPSPPHLFCGPLPTWFASQQEKRVVFSLFPLAAIFHAHLAFCAAPSCAVTPRILFGSVDLLSRMFPNRLTTQSLKSLGLSALHVTVHACAPHGFPEAQSRSSCKVMRVSSLQRLLSQTKMTFKNLILLLTIGLLLMCTACSTSTKAGPTRASQTPSSVKITPANVTLQQWATQKFSGHVYDQNGSEITALDPTIYTFDWEELGANSNLTEVDTGSPYSLTTTEVASYAATAPLTVKVVRAASGNNSEVDLTATTNVTVTADRVASVTIGGTLSSVSSYLVDAMGATVPYDEIIPQAFSWSCTLAGSASCTNMVVTGGGSGASLPNSLNWQMYPTATIYATYTYSDHIGQHTLVSNTLICQINTRRCQ